MLVLREEKVIVHQGARFHFLDCVVYCLSLSHRLVVRISRFKHLRGGDGNRALLPSRAFGGGVWKGRRHPWFGLVFSMQHNIDAIGKQNLHSIYHRQPGRTYMNCDAEGHLLLSFFVSLFRVSPCFYDLSPASSQVVSEYHAEGDSTQQLKYARRGADPQTVVSLVGDEMLPNLATPLDQ